MLSREPSQTGSCVLGLMKNFNYLRKRTGNIQILHISAQQHHAPADEIVKLKDGMDQAVLERLNSPAIWACMSRARISSSLFGTSCSEAPSIPAFRRKKAVDEFSAAINR